MLPIHIVGHAGCGKTTLIVDLVKELVRKDLSVGTMKHSAHKHELDKPGKDSFLHRTAGANPASMVTELMSAIYLPKSPDTSPEKLLGVYYSSVDIVLIEGWITGPFKKIEIWRKAVGKEPLFNEIENVKALISDDYIKSPDLPLFSRSKIDQLIDFILSLD